MALVYGSCLGNQLDDEQQRGGDRMHEEIATRGLADRVLVSENVAVLSFVPRWNRELTMPWTPESSGFVQNSDRRHDLAAREN